MPGNWNGFNALRSELIRPWRWHAAGTLPPMWGQNASLPVLASLNLSSNLFSGTVPDWKQNARYAPTHEFHRAGCQC